MPKLIKIDASRLMIRISSSAKLSTHKLYSYKRNLDLDYLLTYCANSKTANLNISRNLKFAVQIQEFAMTR